MLFDRFPRIIQPETKNVFSIFVTKTKLIHKINILRTLKNNNLLLTKFLDYRQKSTQEKFKVQDLPNFDPFNVYLESLQNLSNLGHSIYRLIWWRSTLLFTFLSFSFSFQTNMADIKAPNEEDLKVAIKG